MIRQLANFFRGVHIGFGITPLPADATPSQERIFVLSWFGIIAVIIGWCVLLLYLLEVI
jgi:hypothetical protein